MTTDDVTFSPERLALDQQAWRCMRCGRIEHEGHKVEPLNSFTRLALCNIHFDGHDWQPVILHVEVPAQ